MSTPSHDSQDVPFRPDDEALQAWIRLANIQLPPRLLNRLLRRFDDDPIAVLAAADTDLGDLPEVQARQIARLRDPTFTATRKQLAWMDRPDVSLLWLTHPNYPRALRELHDPPALLFVRGALISDDRYAVGIVGSRHASPYGRTVAQRFARELAASGLTVVSGGALGIDTATHRGAIEAGGRTVAVLGCGLDIDYPRENRPIFEQIAVSGALISEYAPGTQPETWHFPARNRLISGLSQGVLVVEAPRTSGALITSRFAVEQGRTVMAVPGNIDRPTSVGCNELIKDGALLVSEPSDVLQALGMIVAPARPEHQTALDLTQPGLEGSADRPSASDSRATVLSANQHRLLECLSLVPKHLDAIATEATVDITIAGVEMTLLELTGHVRRLPGNSYVRAL